MCAPQSAHQKRSDYSNSFLFPIYVRTPTVTRSQQKCSCILRAESREFELTLRGTDAMVSSCSIKKLKRNAPPLFRGESPSFLDLPLSQHIAKLTRMPRIIQTRR